MRSFVSRRSFQDRIFDVHSSTVFTHDNDRLQSLVSGSSLRSTPLVAKGRRSCLRNARCAHLAAPCMAVQNREPWWPCKLWNHRVARGTSRHRSTSARTVVAVLQGMEPPYAALPGVKPPRHCKVWNYRWTSTGHITTPISKRCPYKHASLIQRALRARRAAPLFLTKGGCRPHVS